MQKERTYGFRFVFVLLSAHTVVGALHLWAHLALSVTLSLSQWLFVSGIVGVTPWLSLLLLRRRSFHLGWVGSILSMLGSFVFGMYFHFLKVNQDNVDQLPQSAVFFVHLFRSSAMILALIEILGAAMGIVFYGGCPERPQST